MLNKNLTRRLRRSPRRESWKRRLCLGFALIAPNCASPDALNIPTDEGAGTGGVHSDAYGAGGADDDRDVSAGDTGDGGDGGTSTSEAATGGAGTGGTPTNGTTGGTGSDNPDDYDEGSSADDGEPEPLVAPECENAGYCAAALGIGELAADQVGESVEYSAFVSKWLRLSARESLTGFDNLGANPMHLEITLTSPPGEDFDLYVYMDANSPPGSVCEALAGSSTAGVGETDTVVLDWGESGVAANNDSDDRYVVIEVRAARSRCYGAEYWSIEARGG